MYFQNRLTNGNGSAAIKSARSAELQKKHLRENRFIRRTVQIFRNLVFLLFYLSSNLCQCLVLVAFYYCLCYSKQMFLNVGLIYICMNVWGVAILKLDSHPDHNKGPDHRPQIIDPSDTTQQKTNALIARPLSRSPISAR